MDVRIVPPSDRRSTATHMLGDATMITALLVLLSSVAEPVTPGMPQLRRLLMLMNQFPDAAGDTAAAVLGKVYGVVEELRGTLD